jgi:hypothetical protein
MSEPRLTLYDHAPSRYNVNRKNDTPWEVELMAGAGMATGTTLSLRQALRAQYPRARDETIDAALGVLGHADSLLRQALTARLFHALAHLVEGADEATATAALGRPTDYALLLELLTAPAVMERVREEDPLGPARLRWLRDRERLLAAEGGAVPVTTAMEILGLKSRQAVQQRRARGRLLGLPLGGSTYLYPVWQFDRQGVIPGLSATLAALAHPDPWGQVAFLLSGDARLDGLRPLDALRAGRVAETVSAARHYGEQGGG